MAGKTRAEELIAELGMTKHPEGGHFAFMRRFGVSYPATVLPAGYGGDREGVSWIYYLISRGEKSAWHWLRSAELWLWHEGGSLQTTLGGSGKCPVPTEKLKLGSRVERGESFGYLIPADSWQTTELVEGDYALVSCVVSPAFSEDDFSFPPAAWREQA